MYCKGKMMAARWMAFSLLLCVTAFLSYCLGSYSARISFDYEKFDKSLSSLSEAILIYDLIEAGRYAEIDVFVRSGIYRDFQDMAEVWMNRNIGEFEVLRCATTRRVRVLAEGDKLFDADLSSISQAYLKEQCPGEPSHDSWVMD